MNDPIADVLTRIRNAGIAHLDRCDIPAAKVKVAILRILKDEGYIADFREVGEKTRKRLVVFLRYAKNREHAIEGIRRVSSPGQRRYVAARDVPRVRHGMGVTVLSTSQGVMSDREARKRNVGGEVLFEVW